MTPQERFKDGWKAPQIEHATPTVYRWTVYRPEHFVMGDYVDIGAGTDIFAHYGVEIAEGVQIGGHCLIYSYSTIDEALGSPRAKGKVTIGKNALIGANTVILPGVTIGERAIVGACSLVTEDVPAGAIAFGQPAKVHRMRDAI